ncbi:MAG: ABC transporter permease [Thermoanaerobaculia bacterium]
MTNLRAAGPHVKLALFGGLPRNLHLLSELVRRDFSMRFAGSTLGIAWAVLQPLSLVILYWFVFTQIFEGPRTGGGTVQYDNYAWFLISGLLAWIGFQEGIARGTGSIAENATMVRRLTFKTEMLVLVPNISALIFEMIGIGLFLVYLLLAGQPLWSIWLLPFALVIQLGLQTGISFALATIQVFFRDVGQILGFTLSILFYLSPVLYRVEGSRWENVFLWNPLTPLLGLFRSAILSEPLPQPASIVILLVVTGAVFTGGLLLLRRAQPNMADLI